MSQTVTNKITGLNIHASIVNKPKTVLIHPYNIDLNQDNSLIDSYYNASAIMIRLGMLMYGHWECSCWS